MASEGIPVRISKELYDKIIRIRAKLILRGIDSKYNTAPSIKFVTEKIAEKIDEEDIVNEII